MSERRYVDPRTGQVTDDVEVRPFTDVLRELGEGQTAIELSEAFWDVIQRVQETSKPGQVALTLAVGFDGQGRLVVKDEVRVKLSEFSRPSTMFFVDRQGNASRRDPNQPELPSLEARREQRGNTK